MDKLSTLINELCPNGVEYKTLNEIANYRRGSFPQPYGQASWYGGEGAMPFVQVADVTDTFKLVNETKQTISKLAQPKSIFVPKGTVIVTLQGTLGRVAITQYDSYVDRTLAIFESFKIDNIDKKYFAYQLKAKFDVEKQHARGSTLKTITKEEFSKFAIPVPPMEVQCEIVRILDNFTELTAELTAELTTRKKQYEYYREKLLNEANTKASESRRFGDIATIVRGASPRPISSFITDKENGINWIKIGDVQPDSKYITQTKEKITLEGAKKSRMVNVGDFILSNSMSFGRPYIMKIQGCIHDGWLAISNFEKYFQSDFLYYLLNSNTIQHEMEQKASNGTVKNLNADIVRNLELPLPPLAEQVRIVSILDRFDKLCNDISVGLPAEIEARKKQYEYYRDKLLTFEPIQSTEKELA